MNGGPSGCSLVLPCRVVLVLLGTEPSPPFIHHVRFQRSSLKEYPAVRRYTMRWLRVTVVLAALGVVAQVANARVPAFVRQTGLTCNQCHMDVTPAPSFTFTGMKFRLNGFRTPWVAEKVEAGSEGALNGKRLVLTLGSAMSFHARSVMLQQAKPASDPALPEPSAGAPSSDIFGTLATHDAGPIGDHVGVWDELYVYGGSSTGASSGGAGNTHGYIGLNHYVVSLTTNINGNIFG